MNNNKRNLSTRVFSVAPMLKRTDRHCRYFLRLIHPTVFLYTEMVTTGAILFGNRERHLDFDASEHPLALQLGGSNPDQLAECAYIGEQWGYNEINLNIGCPSERVQSGLFGACLMKTPELVAECVAAMIKRVSIPVTVKTRIGVDEVDSYDHLVNFIQKISEAGCQVFIIHARKAWLKGLSPKENREIPPLNYECVYQLKKDFPALEVILNGGILSPQTALDQLNRVDGVMIGRAVYQNPYFLADLPGGSASRMQVIHHYLAYMKQQVLKGARIAGLVQPIFGLFHSQPSGKRWRRGLSQLSGQNIDPKNIEVIEKLLEEI